MQLINKYFEKMSVTSLCEIAFDFKIVKNYFMHRVFPEDYVGLSDKDIVIITFFLIQGKHLLSGIARIDMDKFVSAYYFFRNMNKDVPCIKICCKAYKTYKKTR